ncbi:MAG: hypothetical protein WCI31_12725 [Prolixibacteraceae bacterium]
MKRIQLFAFLMILFSSQFLLLAQQNQGIQYVSDFKNSNHPQIAYWFLTPEILVNDQYLKDLDNMIDHSHFDFIYLDARDGCSFDNLEIMHPVLEKIVAKAHKRNIKVGYRAGIKRPNPIPEEITERFIAEAETTLDHSGNGKCSLDANFVRSRGSFKKDVLKIIAFKKTAKGFYDPTSCKEITDYTFSVKDQIVTVNIKAPKELSGFTAYVMAQFYYHAVSNHSQEAPNGVVNFINTYADIPFDGVMLDEYGNAQIIPPWKMMFKWGNFRLRSYSLPMAKELETRTGEPAFQTLFNMRYAPAGKPEIRMKAINAYMNLMREGAMHVEDAMYKRGKEVYGPNCFIAGHNTFHNSLVNDEIWATGLKWWSIPREYGFTDEKTPTPTQMGIAMSYPQNAMYNMYYDGKIKRFTTKTFTDLRYGIRTFYHAFNDRQWGLGLELPEASNAINPVENCARLMNRFNPALPEIKLLVIFGNEALQNWYPEKSARGSYDINDRLKIEEKAVKIWKSGYRNALVPTDLITSGQLKLDADNKPVLNGHRFDAVIFLDPQYAKEPVLKFLEEYAGKGGKLMIEGTATHNFKGENISGRMAKIYEKAVVQEFSIRDIHKLGIEKNAIKGGCRNEDGSIVFTDIKSLRNQSSTSFSINSGKNNYEAKYIGFAAILADPVKGLQKFAATGFSELRKNGEVILKLEHPADIYLEKQHDVYQITIADQPESNKLIVDKLNNLQNNQTIF